MGNNAYGHTNALNNRNITPRVNNAGNMCTGFNDSGYFLYKLMLDIHNDPEAADVAG